MQSLALSPLHRLHRLLLFLEIGSWDIQKLFCPFYGTNWRKGVCALPLVFKKVYEYSTFCQKMGFMVRTGLPGHPSWLASGLAWIAWKIYSFKKRFPGIKWDLITSFVWTWNLLVYLDVKNFCIELFLKSFVKSLAKSTWCESLPSSVALRPSFKIPAPSPCPKCLPRVPAPSSCPQVSAPTTHLKFLMR